MWESQSSCCPSIEIPHEPETQSRVNCQDRRVEPWRVLQEHPVETSHLPVVTRRYRLPDGHETDWDIFGSERAVAVVAITPRDQVVLARQYRPGPGRILDELRAATFIRERTSPTLPLERCSKRPALLAMCRLWAQRGRLLRAAPSDSPR